MLGNQIGETKGKRTVRRVLSANPPTVEVSFEETGQMLGVNISGMGTYASSIRPDGTVFGEGQGIMMTEDGEALAWTGSGVGKFLPGGSVSYRGMIFFTTASQKVAALHNACVAFEHESEASGQTSTKMWEWK